MTNVLQVQMYLLLILINGTDLGPHCLLMSHNKDDRLFASTYALVSRPVVALPFAEFLKLNIPNDDTAILERTSDSLNEGLPIKMTREKFQRKR